MSHFILFPFMPYLLQPIFTYKDYLKTLVHVSLYFTLLFSSLSSQALCWNSWERLIDYSNCGRDGLLIVPFAD